jgi:LmbE family N-acetylglucosaminyl deacetylase
MNSMQKPVVADVRPRLLAVLAHPDDESFGMGGTLAWYAECGAEVSLVCATRGEVGVVDEHYLAGYASIAERRVAELQCAVERLGLTNVFVLGYRDSGMPGTPDNEHPQSLVAAPQEEVVAQVTQYIRRLRPHVVLTFDPIGGYRHPDHIAIQQATVQAFHAAADPSVYADDLPPYQPHKLYFHVFPRRFLRLLVRVMPLFGKDPTRFGRNEDIDLASIALEDFPTHAVVDYHTVHQRKVEAGRCHASQGGGSGLLRGLFGWIFRLTGSSDRDMFMRAYPPPVSGHMERDLFEGIEW